MWRFDILDLHEASRAASLVLDARGGVLVGLEGNSPCLGGRLLSFDADGQSLRSVNLAGVDCTSSTWAEFPSHMITVPGGKVLGILQINRSHGSYGHDLMTVDPGLKWQLSDYPASERTVFGVLPLDLEHWGNQGAVLLAQNPEHRTTVAEFFSSAGTLVSRFTLETAPLYRGNALAVSNDDLVLALTSESGAVPMVYDRQSDRYTPGPTVESSVWLYHSTSNSGVRTELWRWSAPADVWTDEMLEAPGGGVVIAGTVLYDQARRSLYVAKIDANGRTEWERGLSVEQGGPNLNVRSRVSAALGVAGNLILSTTTAENHLWVGLIAP